MAQRTRDGEASLGAFQGVIAKDSVTIAVTKTPRNERDVLRQVEMARCRRLRPAWA
jgi:hypothetical protein